ncbi:hypothetical protein LINGRAHAP2_LOCUS3909 [Linum grandiflorum]
MVKEPTITTDGANQAERNFDLNADVKDGEDARAASSASVPAAVETAREEYPGWSVSDVPIDPLQLAQLSTRIDDDEEDYDEEG